MNISGVFSGAVVIAWLLVVAALVVIVARASRNQPVRNGGLIVLILAVVAVLLSSASAGLVFINPEERGVVISAIAPKGYREEILQPGLRWVIPFAETVVTYPISRQTYTMSVAAGEGQRQGDDEILARTSDGQEIGVDASIIYSLDPTKIIQVHINWKNTYQDNLVRAQARGIIRDAVSQFRVDEVVSTKRFDLTDMIRKKMTEKLSENGLVMVDFILRNINFSKEYAASVEQKQIAEQQAQQAKFVVESKKQEAEQARQTAQGLADASVIRAQADAKARLIQAEAEAQANNLIGKSLRDNPEIIQYQYVTKLTDKIQVMLVPSDAAFILPFPTPTPAK
ncbi:MAG TPA: prohibitin family protein [Anaerolineaceae bacterium]